MERHILMLEDDGERLERFAVVLKAWAVDWRWVHWRDAHVMIRECERYLGTCDLICLDHDLNPVAGEGDPGDGLDVARFLAPLRLVCPVLIHSSNGDRATRMVGEFQLHDCHVETILPLGVDWIEKYWRERVVRLLSRP